MSGVTNTVNNSNFQQNDYNTAKLFIWGNRFDKATFKNNTGAIATFPAGTVLGRDSSDNTLVPLIAANTTNGRSIPVGILAKELPAVAIAGTVTNTPFCTAGDVNESLVTFNAAETKATVSADGRTFNDGLVNNGIRLIASTELSKVDN